MIKYIALGHNSPPALHGTGRLPADTPDLRPGQKGVSGGGLIDRHDEVYGVACAQPKGLLRRDDV